MADASTVNALKDLTKAVQDQNRTLKSIDDHLSKLGKAVAALNINYMLAHAEEKPGE